MHDNTFLVIPDVANISQYEKDVTHSNVLYSHWQIYDRMYKNHRCIYREEIFPEIQKLKYE